MTLNELKAQAAAMGITTDDAREFGHIGHKATWEAAIDKMSEAVALAADAAKEAQQPAQEAAETLCDVVYSQQSRDIVQWIAAAILTVIFTLGLITVRLTQATWQATAPLRYRASGRIHSELWAAIGPWPDLLIGL